MDGVYRNPTKGGHYPRAGWFKINDKLMKSKAKIVIIGECRVGKTSILLKYVKGWFD